MNKKAGSVLEFQQIKIIVISLKIKTFKIKK